MTDKPMDVERTLRERVITWRGKAEAKLEDANRRGFELSRQFHEGMISAYNIVLTLVAEAVREALREPGAEAAPPTSAFAEFDKAVKYLREHGYGDWDGTANGQEITLTGCANMMREYLRAAEGESTERVKVLEEASRHFPFMGDFGNVTGCEECDWKPSKILQSRQQFIEHIRALATSQERSATEEK
jgi:hypothetical protein